MDTPLTVSNTSATTGSLGTSWTATAATSPTFHIDYADTLNPTIDWSNVTLNTSQWINYPDISFDYSSANSEVNINATVHTLEEAKLLYEKGLSGYGKVTVQFNLFMDMMEKLEELEKRNEELEEKNEKTTEEIWEKIVNDPRLESEV